MVLLLTALCGLALICSNEGGVDGLRAPLVLLEKCVDMARDRILVVDDDHKIVDLIRLYLERDGYRVIAAYDGLDGRRPRAFVGAARSPGRQCSVLGTASQDQLGCG